MRTLTEIIEILEDSPYPNGTYVGKCYTNVTLINDLKALREYDPFTVGEQDTLMELINAGANINDYIFDVTPIMNQD